MKTNVYRMDSEISSSSSLNNAHIDNAIDATPTLLRTLDLRPTVRAGSVRSSFDSDDSVIIGSRSKPPTGSKFMQGFLRSSLFKEREIELEDTREYASRHDPNRSRERITFRELSRKASQRRPRIPVPRPPGKENRRSTPKAALGSSVSFCKGDLQPASEMEERGGLIRRVNQVAAPARPQIVKKAPMSTGGKLSAKLRRHKYNKILKLNA